MRTDPRLSSRESVLLRGGSTRWTGEIETRSGPQEVPSPGVDMDASDSSCSSPFPLNHLIRVTPLTASHPDRTQPSVGLWRASRVL